MPAKRGKKKSGGTQRPAAKHAANDRLKPIIDAMVASLTDALGDSQLDEEAGYYLAHLPEWYDQEGKHVLIHGSEHFGFFPTENAALEEGFRRFGRVPFLVKQVQRDERPMHLGWVIR